MLSALAASDARSPFDERLADERRQAARALLMRPLLTAEHDPVGFTHVRRHSAWLSERFRHLLGYRLTVRGDYARLYKRPHAAYPDRPARIRPGSASPGPEDGWAPFTRRHYVLLALALAALERHHGRAQALIGGLATEVASLGVELGLRVDFERREERKAFAEVLELLCRIGVLRHRDGSREAFVARNEAAEEALFDVEHGRLGDLKATPVSLTDIESVQDLIGEEYPPTEDGERARRRHRIARALIEDSVLYTSDLEPDELDTYRSQRHRLEPELELLTGLSAERRHEGSALVDPSLKLTDCRFPTRSTASTLALLLCERLRALAHDGDRNPLPQSVVAVALAEIGGRVGAAAGPELLGPVLDLLTAHRLIVREPPALVRVLPGLARFACPTLRSTT
ncbi:MAG: TIGR02678 family protein [Solirubrobacteraceae bacterium]